MKEIRGFWRGALAGALLLAGGITALAEEADTKAQAVAEGQAVAEEAVTKGQAVAEAAQAAAGGPGIVWWGEARGGGASGEFAPYLIGSLDHGKSPYGACALLDAGICRPLDRSRRFSWGFGLEGLTGWQKGNEYARWDAAAAAWGSHMCNPPAVWLQQLYGELKYRGVFLMVGMKEIDPILLDPALSSGDLVESGNARPVPQVRVGFIDFQNIPFTRGWAQIQGEVAYGKMTDNGFWRDHFNYYNYHITQGSLYVYKRCYFRSKPAAPFSVTVGMQAGSFFGGTGHFYNNGEPRRDKPVVVFSKSVKSFLKMLLPLGENGEEYYVGSTLGSWDLHARYRFRNNDELSAYFHGPWEDGSGIGRMNGWDGIWGLQYVRSAPGWLEKAVVEYLDFRNQSGSIHWDPDDYPGTTVDVRATGADNYYNNYCYNSWANYGMALGSPYFKAPLYNLDGYPGFTCNRMNGFHIGLSGHPHPRLGYRLLVSYSRGLGRYADPWYHARSNTSMMLEGDWDAHRLLPGLSAKAAAGFDAGKLRGNTFGMLFTVRYSGIIPLKKKGK